jgi:hypothetical protein
MIDKPLPAKVQKLWELATLSNENLKIKAYWLGEIQ